MMRTLIFTIIFTWVLILHSGCISNRNLDSFDSQTSSSINESIHNNVFVCAYGCSKSCTSPKNGFLLQEAWIEKVWKYNTNSIINSYPEIIDDSLIQLVITVSNNNELLKPNKYLREWIIADEFGNSFDSFSDRYMLEMSGNDSLPEKIKINVCKIIPFDFKKQTKLFGFDLIRECK